MTELKKRQPIKLQAVTMPAPFVLKPYAGLYNPYPYGCSLLCNHPTDSEVRELLKKARDSWSNECKTFLLPEEIAAIRAGIDPNVEKKRAPKPPVCIVNSVPEELFRRYTETDSRPLTPTPTLASAQTRASGSRKCVTPDPIPTVEVKEKTLLILDLRRSHSQETMSWYGGGSLNQEPPLIKIIQVPTRSISPQVSDCTKQKKSNAASLTLQRPKSSHAKETEDKTILKTSSTTDEKVSEDEEGEFIRRRGKKKKKRGRDNSCGPSVFPTSVDPETQVAAIGIESHNPSARPSLVSATHDNLTTEFTKPITERTRSFDIDSYLDKEILKQLRRELNEEIVDNEFNSKRRAALEEAFRTIVPDKIICEELKNLQNELKLTPVNAEMWLSLPRTFSRASARFELPMDSRVLNTMKPLDYIKEHVYITSARKLLYNCIFNKYKITDEGNKLGRRIPCKRLQEALNLMMGREMTEKQTDYLQGLVGWSVDDEIDFKTFCGLCALCERLLAPAYCKQLPNKKSDPCHEIEIADFESLLRRLDGQTPDQRLIDILYAIRDS